MNNESLMGTNVYSYNRKTGEFVSVLVEYIFGTIHKKNELFTIFKIISKLFYLEKHINTV